MVERSRYMRNGLHVVVVMAVVQRGALQPV